ncbi:diguanylate cyclase [Oleiagrimonas sp. C23AA]|uniref:diguanylate cyclase n=1 Tax=Oleiagrimonas sp. C23AA TaxID=2719047 RepID=UPI0014244548|nr:diguanylate cyclase [Oleiagrimonas sp. C23AA]NII09889.1 diguanylate cyclase [Oleiagrimonas sp. C23AA]
MDSTPHWERRYYEAVDRMEADERQWQAVDGLLRRLVSRLRSAAEGRHHMLDDALERVRHGTRESAEGPRLEALIGSLSDALAQLDGARPLPDAEAVVNAPEPAQPGTTHAGVLLAVLEQLPLDTALEDERDALQQAIADGGDIASHGRALVGLVESQCQRLRADKAALERLLVQVSHRLDSMGRYLEIDQASGEASRQELETNMAAQVRQLGNEIDTATELDTLRTQVRERLHRFDDHLRAFREREAERSRGWADLSEQMQKRINELEQSARELTLSLDQNRQQAATDLLTGLANRLALESRMAEVCRRRAGGEGPIALIVFDVDHFKRINDDHGHAAGDKALRIVAHQLKKALDGAGFLARFGGEEFVLILEQHDTAAALTVAERLGAHIAQLGFHMKGQPLTITLSAGVTAIGDDDSPEQAFERADQAMYRAKRAGRNRCELG